MEYSTPRVAWALGSHPDLRPCDTTLPPETYRGARRGRHSDRDRRDEFLARDVALRCEFAEPSGGLLIVRDAPLAILFGRGIFYKLLTGRKLSCCITGLGSGQRSRVN